MKIERAKLPPAPGTFVDVGGYRLHVQCRGAGSPPVLLESALAGSSLSWTLVQPEVATFTRACSYDRAGFGWSEAGPLPRSLDRSVADLEALLARLDGHPWVLVGHSYGALILRRYAARQPARVAGLVLVDPADPEELAAGDEALRRRIAAGARLCRRGAWAARSGVARFVAGLVGAGALGVARVIAGIVGRGELGRQDEQILAPVRRLPRELRPILRRLWTRPEFFDALGSQISTVIEAARTVAADSRDLGALPLCVISSGATSPARLAAHEATVRLSRRGRHLRAPASGHWVPLDDPQIVVEAIRVVVDELRSPRPEP